MTSRHQFQEHTRSYYAETVNEKIEYPVLQGEKTADICVIGGGFTGVATALDLAVCDLNEVVDYYRLSTDKRMLYGGRSNYSGRGRDHRYVGKI